MSSSLALRCSILPSGLLTVFSESVQEAQLRACSFQVVQCFWFFSAMFCFGHIAGHARTSQGLSLRPPAMEVQSSEPVGKSPDGFINLNVCVKPST